MLYHTADNGVTVRRTKLDFTPSEIAFDEEDADTFIALDKIDPARKVINVLCVYIA